ncbi:MAG TPA: ImmA/IrrE family metallo-endopeptidase [Pyrinomonadaceae bacterium]|nr:ImmA/IrrE family metallo-endopeptidase [Pyrinomonadaceae bacterium]
MARSVVRASPTSGNQLDHQALAIVRNYQPWVLENPSRFDVERFFENDLVSITGVNFDYRPLRYDVLGYTDSDEMVSVVSASLAEEESNLFRATVAHEIGHAILHVPQFRRKKQLLRFVDNDDMDVGLRMYREDEIPLYENPEWQAWRFAKALLMPVPAVVKACQLNYSIEEMSIDFGVSVKFTRSRLKELKLIAHSRA